MKAKAFTLVEILVVVGILSLLAAILFPAFNRVRALGRRTTCASNLRQIGMALNQYAQDYKFYPKMADGLGTGASAAGGLPRTTASHNLWPDKIFPYVKQENIFVCPSDPDHLYHLGCPPDDMSNPDHPISFLGSYSLNAPYTQVQFDFTGPGSYSSSYDPRVAPSPVRYTRPSSTILVSDGTTFSTNDMFGSSMGAFIAPGYTQPPPTDITTLQKYGVPDRHEGGVNVCFADGHVKWMRLDSLLKVSLWRINGPE